MRIALITSYKRDVGGVETVNKLLMEIFAQEGYDVDLISAEEILKKKEVGFFGKIFSIIIGWPYLTSNNFNKKKNIYDLVICNGEFSFGIKHSNCINVFHGSAYGYRKALDRTLRLKTKLYLIRQDILQRIGSKNKKIVSVSRYIKEILNCQNIKVHYIIPNSVDTTKFKPLNISKEYDCIMIGSYANKGYAKGYDIIDKLVENGIKITCVSSQKPNKYTRWIKKVDNEKLPEIYCKHKMLIFPSRFEACPMVPIEAMACGLPIIMSNVGIGPELKIKIPEFVVDKWDYKEYIKRIEIINSNYKYYSELARKYVIENHSYDKFKKRWIELIKNISYE